MCDEEVMISHPILMSICVLSLQNIFVKASERQLDVCVCVCVWGGGGCVCVCVRKKKERERVRERKKIQKSTQRGERRGCTIFSIWEKKRA